MDSNKYYQAIERIKTPPELKEKTRYMLMTETVKHSRQKRMWTIGRTIATAAVFVLLFGISVWLVGRQGAAPFDMEFVFDHIEEMEPLRMAHTYPLRQTMSLDERPYALPDDLPDGLTGPEGGITAFFSAPSDVPDAVLGEAIYRTLDGAILTVVFTDTSMLFLPIEPGNSYIGDVEIGLGFLSEDEKYVASFEKSGYTYLLTAEGMSRQEFIDVLIHFVS